MKEELIELSAKIKNNKFYYSYSIGKDENHNMEADIDSTKLIAFLELLKVLQNAAWCHNDKFNDEVKARCWIKANPDKAKLL